jgi:site-specific recombinase XerD
MDRSASFSRPPQLLDQMRQALRSRHYSRRTEQTYCHWVKRFIYFHNVRHPAEMSEAEINAFLTHLAVKEKVSASTQNQALSALLFLYRHVLGREIGDLGKVIRARKPKRLPVVMTRDEVRSAE